MSIAIERRGEALHVVAGHTFTVEDAVEIGIALHALPDGTFTIDLGNTRTFYAPALADLSRVLATSRVAPVLLGLGGSRSRLLRYLERQDAPVEDGWTSAPAPSRMS